MTTKREIFRLVLSGLAIFLIALVLYIRTLQPTLGGNTYDSEEFQHIAYSLGIAHPTGYPLYLLLGKLWITLLPIGTVAYRMNLMSAVLTAAAASVFFFALDEITREKLSAFLGVVFLALSYPIWHHAVAASVGPLNLLLLVCLLYAVVLWRKQRLALAVPAFIFGLTLAHHRSSLALLPGLVVLLIGARPTLDLRVRDLAAALLVLFAPLLFYLYIPLRGVDSPWYTNTFDAFVREVGGTDTLHYTAQNVSQWIDNLRAFLQALNEWLGLVGLSLVILGVLGAWRAYRRTAQDGILWLGFGLMTLGSIAFGLSVSGEQERYLAPAFMYFVVWATVGAAAIIRSVEGSALSSISENMAPRWAWLRAGRGSALGAAPRWARLRAGRGSALGAVLGILILLNAIQVYPQVDLSRNDRTWRLWNEILVLPIEKNAVIIGNWSELNALRYMQYVEGRRNDLQQVGIVDTGESVANAIEDALTLSPDVYLMPSAQSPTAEYHYHALGPLLHASREPDYHQPNAPTALQEDFGAMELVGYGMNASLQPDFERATTTVEPLQSVRVSLYWRVKERITSDYDVRVRLLDADGVALWQKIEPPLRGFYPTSRWQTGTSVTDNHGVFIPPGTPPGSYEIEVSLIDSQSKSPLPAHARMIVNVAHSSVPLADQIFIRTPLMHDWAGLRLLGFNYGGNSVRHGAALNFSLGWVAHRQLEADYALDFHLSDAQGNRWHTIQMPLLRNLPTTEWQKDDAFRAYYELPIPTDAPLGPTHLSVQVTNPSQPLVPASSNQDSIELFTFSIDP